jgi:hypothetical protein
MASGTFYPTSNVIQLSGFTHFAPGGSGGPPWGVAGFTNPGNASADDGVYATNAPANHTMEGNLFFFDLSSIPDGATITSALVRVERLYSTTSSGAADCIAAFSSQSGGNPSGMLHGAQDASTAEPTVDTVRTSAFTVTVAQLKAANFCVAYAMDRESLVAYTGSLDYLRLEISWNLGGGASHGSIGSAIRSSVLAPVKDVLLPHRDNVA